MKMLFITQTPEFGGTEKHVVELVRRLANGAECTIVCLAEDFYSQHLGMADHVRIVRYPRIWDWRFLRFWRLIMRHRASVIVFPKGVPDQFPLSAYLAARVAGAGRIVCIEQLMWEPAPLRAGGAGMAARLKSLIGWRARHMAGIWLQARLAHLTVCVSSAVQNRLVNEYGYPRERTVVIHNGADLRHYAPRDLEEAPERARGSSATIHLLCVARLSPVKRIDLLMDALAILVQSHGAWKCTIVGGGPLEQELRAQVHRLGLSNRVTLTGHVPDTKPYVMQADLCVLPSEQEGLPLSLAEAMAAGVPCVASDVGGTGEIVIHGKTGLLFKSRSVEDLVQALTYMMVHAEERLRMGEEAYRWAHQQFDLDRQLGKLGDLLAAK